MITAKVMASHISAVDNLQVQRPVGGPPILRFQHHMITRSLEFDKASCPSFLIKLDKSPDFISEMNDHWNGMLKQSKAASIKKH